MFDAALVIATAREGESLGKPLWLPMLPSYQFPTIEWAPGEIDSVSRVDFPEGQPVQITLAGAVVEEARPRYLDHGWQIRPSTTNGVAP